jgi:hypothetical protein
MPLFEVRTESNVDSLLRRCELGSSDLADSDSENAKEPSGSLKDKALHE